MGVIKSRRVTTTEEKRIVIGLITSTDFITSLGDNIDLAYFKNTYLERIADWCLTFYDEHKKAPGLHIQDIFESEKTGMPTEQANMTETLLLDLSSKYDPEQVNTDYLLSTTRAYFQERELEILVGNISVLKEQGNLEEAEKQIDLYKKVSFALDSDVYINPGDPKTRERIYKKKAQEEDDFFVFPGDMGKFIGNMKRKDLIGVFAPSKRGKSFLLNYFMNQGVMSNRKVAFFSIEMTDTESLLRADKSFVPTVDSKKDAGMYDCPVFDCMHNQTGACADRKSDVHLRNEQGEIDQEVAERHVVCTDCRMSKTERERFSPVVWKEKVFRKTNDLHTMQKEMRKFNALLDRNCRIIVRDKYSLTMPQIYQDIERLAYKDNFIPEIIIIDYLDILQVQTQEKDWKLENEKWKQAARLGGETSTLVVTATQGNIGAISAEVLNESHLGGWTGKIQHVNGLISINQTSQEKREGIWRLGVTGLRSEEFYQDETCMVLQDLKTGQFNLDSYYKRNIF
jgi:replicative DNA helicase